MSEEASSFGLAHIKKEGCAVHPDDIERDLTPEQYARQLAAYEYQVLGNKAYAPGLTVIEAAEKGGAK